MQKLILPKIEIIPCVYHDLEGLKRQWAVKIDGKQKFIFNSKEELEAFKRGIHGND